MQPDLDLILREKVRTKVTRENIGDLKDELPKAMGKMLDQGQDISLKTFKCCDGQKRRLLVIHDSPGSLTGRGVFEYHPGSKTNGCRKGVWLEGSKTLLFDHENYTGVFIRPGLTPKPRGMKVRLQSRPAHPGYEWEYIY